MNLASIDIGSNTVLLLIAKEENGNLNPILNEYQSPRIAKGLTTTGVIREESIDKLMTALRHYKGLIDSNNCEKTVVTATNAFRIASNAEALQKRIKEEFGWDVRIISGDEEAKLTYLGAASSFPIYDEKVIIDIGGGSTEVVYGKNSEILYKKSFNTGVVSLTEEFLNSFPYDNDQILKAEKFLDDMFDIISEEIPVSVPVIAVAGTPTTLSCIVQEIRTYDEFLVEGSILTRDDLRYLFKELQPRSPEQIRENFGQVTEGREDLLFSGLLILEHVHEKLMTEEINVSTRGLRYGSILSYLK
jgi:exopolyphosphatase/guanosine-5'-triphosphate,3'-diphosphate pyrophosphatase